MIETKVMLKAWQLYFDKSDGGYANRHNVVSVFAPFWENSNAELMITPEKFMIGGNVYGRAGFNDGDEILTSHIDQIVRVKHSMKNGIPHDLLCATTKSGSKYYFYSDEHNAYMALMLGDMLHIKQLDNTPGHYLKPELQGGQLL